MQVNMFDELYRIFYDALACDDLIEMQSFEERFRQKVEGLRIRLDDAVKEARLYRRNAAKAAIENRKLKAKLRQLTEDAVSDDGFLAEEK